MLFTATLLALLDRIVGHRLNIHGMPGSSIWVEKDLIDRFEGDTTSLRVEEIDDRDEHGLFIVITDSRMIKLR